MVEKVDAVFSYPGGAPNAGTSYPVGVKWEYQGITTENTYTEDMSAKTILLETLRVYSRSEPRFFPPPLNLIQRSWKR